MPGHDYVKSGRLTVTDKTKPIYIYIYIYLHVQNYIPYSIMFIKNQQEKKIM